MRIEFICIIWTVKHANKNINMFLRIEFICIIWTINELKIDVYKFLRIEFICIIWTDTESAKELARSWGLNLFVLFELQCLIESYTHVLEDWIYLYYLNRLNLCGLHLMFLRIEFICIIWTLKSFWKNEHPFLRIEFICIIWTKRKT